jgi:hypothetical protein
LDILYDFEFAFYSQYLIIVFVHVVMHSNKPNKGSLRKNLLLLKCECGYEILFLPDLKALGKAIEEHVLEHKNKNALTQKEVDVLQDSLIAQALKLVSEITNSSEDIHIRFSANNRKKLNLGD